MRAVGQHDADGVSGSDAARPQPGGDLRHPSRELGVGPRLARVADSSNSVGRYPGWFAIQVEVLTGKERNKVEEIVFEEVKKLREKPVSAAE